MHVNNKIMYHYHKHGVGLYDDSWQVGNEITVDNNFESYFCSILNWFSTSVEVEPDNHLETFDKILSYYLKEDNIKQIDLELLKKIRNI